MKDNAVTLEKRVANRGKAGIPEAMASVALVGSEARRAGGKRAREKTWGAEARQGVPEGTTTSAALAGLEVRRERGVQEHHWSSTFVCFKKN